MGAGHPGGRVSIAAHGVDSSGLADGRNKNPRMKKGLTPIAREALLRQPESTRPEKRGHLVPLPWRVRSFVVATAFQYLARRAPVFQGIGPLVVAEIETL